MWKETRARLGGLAVGVLAVIAIVVLAFQMQAGSAAAQAEPEMAFQIGDCTADCEVAVGEPFTLSIVGPTLPDGGFISFQTELFLGGLTYSLGECEDEVAMEPLGVCFGPIILPTGQVGHGGLTGIGAEPPASTSFNLVDVPLTCPEEGTYEVAITAWPSREQGSYYIVAGQVQTAIAVVGTRELEVVSDVDPQKHVFVEYDVGAVMTVNCQAPEEPTEEPDGDGDGPTATPEADGLPTTGGAGSLDAGGSSATVLWLAGALLGLGAVALAAAAMHLHHRGRRAA